MKECSIMHSLDQILAKFIARVKKCTNKNHYVIKANSAIG